MPESVELLTKEVKTLGTVLGEKQAVERIGYRWLFPKILVPQNGWFITENPIKMVWIDLGVPVFLETPRYYMPNMLM